MTGPVIGLLHFSGTGNSAWVAAGLESRLRALGAAVLPFNLEDPGAPGLDACTAVGLVHPVYGATLPALVVRRMAALALPASARFFVVATFGFQNACGPVHAGRRLGRRVDAYFSLRMFNNISTPALRSPIKPPDRRRALRPALERRLDGIARAVIAGRRVFEGLRPPWLAGIVIRRALGDRMAGHWRSLGVDRESCNSCGKCQRECPARAIRLEAGMPVFSPDCTACMRCYNRCPRLAITVDGLKADPAVHPRYLGPWA